uniref:Uncharacterized protein n=1 Tax=Passalora fulva TaxID=5499 RepID=A0A9Q8P3P0_PASFU
MTGREIVEKLGMKEVVGAKADNRGDKKTLEMNKEWTLKIGKTAKVSHQQYIVIAHRIPRSFNI